MEVGPQLCPPRQAPAPKASQNALNSCIVKNRQKQHTLRGKPHEVPCAVRRVLRSAPPSRPWQLLPPPQAPTGPDMGHQRRGHRPLTRDAPSALQLPQVAAWPHSRASQWVHPAQRPRSPGEATAPTRGKACNVAATPAHSRPPASSVCSAGGLGAPPPPVVTPWMSQTPSHGVAEVGGRW